METFRHPKTEWAIDLLIVCICVGGLSTTVDLVGFTRSWVCAGLLWPALSFGCGLAVNLLGQACRCQVGVLERLYGRLLTGDLLSVADMRVLFRRIRILRGLVLFAGTLSMSATGLGVLMLIVVVYYLF